MCSISNAADLTSQCKEVGCTESSPSVRFPEYSGHTPPKIILMEQHALRSVNNCVNTNIYSYLEASGGQSSNLYLNVVHFFNTSINQTSAAA